MNKSYSTFGPLHRGLVFSNPLTTSATFNAWAGPPPAELLQEMWTAPPVPAKGVQVLGSSHWDTNGPTELNGYGWIVTFHKYEKLGSNFDLNMLEPSVLGSIVSTHPQSGAGK